MSENARRIVLGIDLGTTFSSVAYVNDYGRPEVIADPTDQRGRLTPSVVFFDEDAIIVGWIARQNATAFPDQSVQFIKRSMGKDQKIEVGPRKYTPPEISAMILKKLAQVARDELGQNVADAVITVPAYFGDAERTATVEAGRIAGLNVLGVLNEPTAAALAYGLQGDRQPKRIMVYDLGGGTFDVSLLELDGDEITVKATDGDTYLGGKDWDDLLISHVAEFFEDDHGLDPLESIEAVQELRDRAEMAKIALSSKLKATVICNYMGKTSRATIARSTMEDLSRHYVDRTEQTCRMLLDEAGWSWNTLDELILVGGSTRMPMIPEMLMRVSGKQPRLYEPDLCIAMGAAIYAQKLALKEQTTPVDQALAALSAVRITNVNSHSLGVVALNREGRQTNHVLIRRNTHLPCQQDREFYVPYENQTGAQIRIVEGDDENPANCHEIGILALTGLPQGRPANQPVSVTYRYNEDGVLEVEARDENSGTVAKTEIRRACALSAERIEASMKSLAAVEVG